MTHKRQAGWITIATSLIVHGFFCAALTQIAAQNHSFPIPEDVFTILFFPHAMLMYFMPPSEPFKFMGEGVVVIVWWRFAGKMATTYPASLAYGLGVGSIYYSVVERKRDDAYEA